MGGFLKAVTTDPALDTVFIQQGAGISITLKKRDAGEAGKDK
jgi:hypothetical protein